jgi:hypothetical protein
MIPAGFLLIVHGGGLGLRLWLPGGRQFSRSGDAGMTAIRQSGGAAREGIEVRPWVGLYALNGRDRIAEYFGALNCQIVSVRVHLCCDVNRQSQDFGSLRFA